VSKWTINKTTLAVTKGEDLSRSAVTWNSSTTSYNAPGTTAWSRFCSADLPAQTALYNASTGLGTQNKIFMNGEENATTGRAFGHVVTGAAAGTSYELPALGRYAWENSVANPTAQDKTIVAGTDDNATDGQVYVYVGNKTNAGTDVDRAGLTNGNLFGFKLDNGVTQESRTFGLGSSGGLTTSATFTLASLGDVRNKTGTTINSDSNTAGVMRFARPEDAAWNPGSPNQLFFVSTDNTTANGGRSRLWRATFNDISAPNTGSLDMLLTGTEGQEMFDNITVFTGRGDGHTRVLLQEDVGGNARSGKIWLYDVTTSSFLEVAKHDPTRFGDGAQLRSRRLTTTRNRAGSSTPRTSWGTAGSCWTPRPIKRYDQRHHHRDGRRRAVAGDLHPTGRPRAGDDRRGARRGRACCFDVAGTDARTRCDDATPRGRKVAGRLSLTCDYRARDRAHSGTSAT
jgi:hypothetical protein